MNEIEIVKTLAASSPVVAALVWALWRNYKTTDTFATTYADLVKAQSLQYGAIIKDSNDAVNRSTEMLGRAGAYLARAADVIGDLPKGKQ